MIVGTVRRFGASVLVLFLATAWSSGGARLYFVSPSGSNSNSGESVSRSLQSINLAIRKAAAGDTIYVCAGTYRELISFTNKKGRPEHPICLVGLSPSVDEYPVIDGGAVRPSSTATSDWMNISDCEWIEIARLKFKNGWTFPVKVIRSSYLTFRSCQFWGGKRVINASTPATHHILVEDCFWDQGGDYLWRIEHDSAGIPAWTAMHHGSMAYFNGSLIDFHGTGGSIVIRRNTITNAYQAVRYRGVQGYDSNVEIYDNHVSNMRDNDFEPEYFTYNLHIYHNVSHNIHKTLSVDNVEGGQIYYYGNIVTADTDAWSLNICSGIWKIYGSERTLSYPLYAFNNSFFVPGIAFHTMSGKAKLLKHFNNAYYFLKDGCWDLNEWDTSDEFDYDISNRSWPPNLTRNGQESHGLMARVAFVDPGHGDLRQKPGSAGIDAGRAVSLKELEWTQAFRGKAPDVGAYEADQLVEGPPFRFVIPPNAEPLYREKPRIVRDRRENNQLVLYFSDKINPSSVRPEDIELYSGETELKISSASFPRNNYELVLETKSGSLPKDLSISFRRLPSSLAGERVTSWASTITIHKSAGPSN